MAVGGPTQPITSGASLPVAWASHSMVAAIQQGASPEQVFRESGGSCRLLLTYSQKSHSIPSAAFCWSKASHRVSADSGRGPHMGTNPWRHAGSHFWKQAISVTWQARTSPEPWIKAFSIPFLSTLDSSQSFA